MLGLSGLLSLSWSEVPLVDTEKQRIWSNLVVTSVGGEFRRLTPSNDEEDSGVNDFLKTAENARRSGFLLLWDKGNALTFRWIHTTKKTPMQCVL